MAFLLAAPTELCTCCIEDTDF